MGVQKIDEIRIVIGLDERSLSQRPGVAAEPEPKPEPPVRAALNEPAPQAPVKESPVRIDFQSPRRRVGADERDDRLE